MKDKSDKEDDEEMVRVPEDFKVAASDNLHGGGDNEDEGQRDHDTCEASDGGKDKVGWNLLRILRHQEEEE